MDSSQNMACRYVVPLRAGLIQSLSVALILGRSLFDPLGAQSMLIGTASGGGSLTGTNYPATSIPTFFANVGQPMVYARPSKPFNAVGIGAAADFMFGSGAADASPPTITAISGTSGTTPPIDPANLTTINVSMDDDKGVAFAQIFYRKILGGAFTSLSLTHGTGTTWSATFPLSDPMGVEFYFRAFDSQNAVTSSTFYAYAEYKNPQVTSSLLKYGDQPSDYRIISVPFDVSGNANAVFTDLPGVDKSVYRLWQYSSGNWTEYSDFQTIDRGAGYFLILNKNDVLMKVGTKQEAPSNNRSHLFKMSLTSDWNLIGNPYPVPMQWDAVLALNGNPGSVVNKLYTYTSSGYQQVTTLAPYQGAFVKVNGTPPSNFQISLDTQTVAGGRIADLAVKDLASQNWRLPFTLKQGSAQNSLAGIGMSPDATVGLDPFDGYNPPHMFDSPDLLSQRPDLGVTDLTDDIVNTQPSYIWRFEAKSGSDEEVEISWDNQHFGNNSIPLFLYDVGKDEVIDMREQSSYSFHPSISGQFKVYYGIQKGDISPDELAFTLPYPNPFNQTTEFRFALPGTNDSFEVQLDVLNSVGQRVTTLTKGTFSSGRHSVLWSGAGDDGEKVPSALYFYKFTVDGKQSKALTGRVIYTR